MSGADPVETRPGFAAALARIRSAILNLVPTEKHHELRFRLLLLGASEVSPAARYQWPNGLSFARASLFSQIR
jgi:hypothetical protein